MLKFEGITHQGYEINTATRFFSTDINFKYRRLNRDGDYFWLGSSYRFLNDQLLKPLNIGPMAGIIKNKFYFAYSYQLALNDLSSFNSGTHMITIGFDFIQGGSECTKDFCWRQFKYRFHNASHLQLNISGLDAGLCIIRLCTAENKVVSKK